MVLPVAPHRSPAYHLRLSRPAETHIVPHPSIPIPVSVPTASLLTVLFWFFCLVPGATGQEADGKADDPTASLKAAGIDEPVRMDEVGGGELLVKTADGYFPRTTMQAS